MSKKKKKQDSLGFDPRTEFLHHPHDKYARFILKIGAVTHALIRHYVPAHVVERLDMDTLSLSNDSFLDEYLQEHLSDICYTVRTKAGEKVEVTILIEHKSTAYQGSVLFQLNRYISNVQLAQEKQKKPLTLVLPILLYHGDERIRKESPAVLFPDAPEVLLPYMPSFDYIVVDIQQMDNATIETIEDLLLQKFLHTLKNSRNSVYILSNWNKFVIFAPRTGPEVHWYNQVTIIYLNATSIEYNLKFKDMDNLISPEEATAYKPYIFELYEKGIEKGIEKGMAAAMEKLIIAFIGHNPDLTDAQIAQNFDIEAEVVRHIRLKMKHQ